MMRFIPLVAAVVCAGVLVLNIGVGDGPAALAASGRAGPQATDRSSASREAPLPNLQGFPVALAPDELATVPFPNTSSAVTALFQRLPPEVAGHARSPQFDVSSRERTIVGYGEERRVVGVGNHLLRLQAVDLTRGDFFPTNWTGAHVIAFMARQGQEGGREENVFWMRDERPVSMSGSAERFLVYEILWGRVDSSWMFSAQADTPENRDALVTAFVVAARSANR
jgi:hypothetical protein